MRILVAIAVMTAFAGPAASQTRLPLRAIVDNPRAAIGENVRFGRVACVDPGGAGFICLAKVGGRVLRVKADYLGASSPQSVAELLIGDCKGTINLDNPVCQFDIVIRPKTANKSMVETPAGSFQAVEVYSPQIDMFR